MEISGIDRVHTVNKLGTSEKVTASTIVSDTLSISSDAQKKAEWVEMLKSMPDVRPEKIQAALSNHSYLQPEVLAEVARQLLNS